MTYYKYAEREANSQINWAEVSKGLSDTIIQVDKDRQAKKAAIDAATREDMTKLANGPKGENTTASEWTINYANDMMNYRLSLDKLLKSGQMKLSDYQVAAQNSVDATNLVFTLAQEYQDQYKVVMDRSRSGESSRLEPELAALNESFANISNTVPTINSTNGMVYLSTPEAGEDGVQKLGKNYVSLQALRNRVNSKINAYNLGEGISAATSTLGKNTITELGKTSFRRTGVITEITDPTLRKTYTDWEAATIENIIADKNQLASILADNMNVNPRTGNQYSATYSKEEFDADKSGDVILMENRNGSGVITPKFKEEQIEDAKAYVKSQMTSYIDKTAEKSVFQEPDVYRPSQAEIDAKNAEKTQKTNAGYWQQIRWGTPEQKKTAANILLGTKAAIDKGLYDMTVTPDGKGLKLMYTKESGFPSRTIPIAPGASAKEWAALGVELHGIEDADQAVKAAGAGSSKPFQPATGGKLAGRDYNQPVSDAYKQFSDLVVAKPLADLVKEDGAEITATQLSNAYGDLGFSFDFEESTYGVTDDVIIKYNDKVVGRSQVDKKGTGAANIEKIIRQTLRTPTPAASGSGIGSKYNK